MRRSVLLLTASLVMVGCSHPDKKEPAEGSKEWWTKRKAEASRYIPLRALSHDRHACASACCLL